MTHNPHRLSDAPRLYRRDEHDDDGFALDLDTEHLRDESGVENIARHQEQQEEIE